MGGSRTRIVLRHIIPNTIGTIIVNATFNIADAILLLAALGFLGLGVPSPQTDWGSMLSNGVNYALRRLLVGDLPGRPLHRARRRRLQLHRRRAPRRARGAAPAALRSGAGAAARSGGCRRRRQASGDRRGVAPDPSPAPVGVCSGKWQAARWPVAEGPQRRLLLGADAPGRTGSGCGSGSPTAGRSARGARRGCGAARRRRARSGRPRGWCRSAPGCRGARSAS